MLTMVGRAKKFAIHFGGGGVTAMLRRQNLSGMTQSVQEVEGGAIGCLGGEPLLRNGNVFAVVGTPINSPDFSQITDANSARRLLPLCDGAFAAVFWDAQQHVLVVVTDCLGMQPLYMQQTESELRLVSETKAVNGEPDLAAWGAFISIGHPVGNRSLVAGLQRVPPASVLTYDCRDKKLTIRRYWDWPEPSDAWRHYDFSGALEAEIKAYAAHAEPGTLLLSGGFDSRLLLLLLKRAQVPFEALVVSHDDELDNADGWLAERLAEANRVDYSTFWPVPDFFSSSDYLDYLVASDVGYPSLDLFISKVASAIRGGVVWDGLVPGFLLNAPHQSGDCFSAYWQSEVEGRDSNVWEAARIVLRPEVASAMFEGFVDDFHDEKSRMSQDSYGVSRFILENRARNRASINPHKVYANRAAAFTPGVSTDFATHAASIPPRERLEGRFCRQLLRRVDKQALQLPVVSGGYLKKGTGLCPAYYHEHLRMTVNKYRTLYPSLFALWEGDRRRGEIRRNSTFLDERLLDTQDSWLNPSLRETLGQTGDIPKLAWRLLFHWKVWHWVHDGTLKSKLGDQL